MNRVPRIAVTSGEPAGIGPDLCLSLPGTRPTAELVVIGDPDLLAARARQLGTAPISDCYRSGVSPCAGACLVEPVGPAADTRAGRLDPANAHYVLEILDRAITGCLSGEFDAMVTCPVHKGVINDAGIAFTGHTEYLAAKTGAAQAVMLLAAPGLRVALATTHLALRDVADALTRSGIETLLRALDAGLRRDFAIAAPHILVAGLNPHAGEQGHLGREEIDVLEPALEALRLEGLDLEGPLPADTLFTPPFLRRADAVLAMYHDQGLPVLKHLGFGRAVNITLGLPIVRTSVDHGTAVDIAGTGRAANASLIAAIDTALVIAANRAA